MDRATLTKMTTLHRRRLRNQLGNLLTSLTTMGLISGWVVAGAFLGVRIGRVLPYGSSGAVILSTLIGFSIGLLAASAFSPRMVRIAFGARAARSKSLDGIIKELQDCTRGSIVFNLFSVEQLRFPGFGHNVVVTGIQGAKRFFKPAVFASESVLTGCSDDEIYAILAHELAHLRERHLMKRVLSGIVTGALGSLFASCLLVGLQLMGFKTLAMGLATVSAIIPVGLIWLNLQRLLRVQEKEADWIAVRDFDARPLDLLNALKKLTIWNDSDVHPLVRERMLILQGLWLSKDSWEPGSDQIRSAA